MPDLATFQRDFASVMSVPEHRATPMSVYRNTTLLGAVEALGDNFPVVRALVGEAAFTALAVAHARECPPVSPILALYGRRFPEWLARHPVASDLPYLADVADCERLWVGALHAADAPTLELSTLQVIAADDLVRLPLTLHPATQIAWHETPSIAIWLAHQDAILVALEPEWRPTGALFTRPHLDVAGAAIDAAQHCLLAAIGRGETLGMAAAAAAALAPRIEIGACFAGLVQRGAFVAL